MHCQKGWCVMIIRSQDKKKIYNFEQIRRIFVDTNMIIVDDVSILGEYSTEEKAIKVLDMIQNAYYNFEYSKFLGCDNDTFAGCVFEMPQDSEV